MPGKVLLKVAATGSNSNYLINIAGKMSGTLGLSTLGNFFGSKVVVLAMFAKN